MSGNGYAGIQAQIGLENMFDGREAYQFHIMGQRTLWTDATNFHDVAEYLGTTATATELTGAESFEIVSSSANDTAAGTGVRTVEICYIDAAYAIACTTLTMNGTTPVPVGVLGAKMILWMETKTAGTGNVAAGNISLRISGAGATHEYIKAGGNKSMSGRFMIPDGFEGLLLNWDTHAIRQNMDCRIRATVNTHDRTLGSVYVFQDNAFMAADSSGEHSLPYLLCPARSKIKVSAITGSTASTPRVDISYSILLVKG
jgi:hypothetical protein